MIFNDVDFLLMFMCTVLTFLFGMTVGKEWGEKQKEQDAKLLQDLIVKRIAVLDWQISNQESALRVPGRLNDPNQTNDPAMLRMRNELNE